MVRPAFQLLLSPEWSSLRCKHELEEGRKAEAAAKPPHSIEAKSKIASPFPKAEPATPPQNQPWADRKSHLPLIFMFYLGNLRDAGQLAQSCQGDPLVHCLQFGPGTDKGTMRAPMKDNQRIKWLQSHQAGSSVHIHLPGNRSAFPASLRDRDTTLKVRKRIPSCVPQGWWIP